jgi:pimeloyl-ACP methyl ester carboxylesterase
MPLREVNEPPGAPWAREFVGRLDRLTVDSEVLAGNPAGDPSRRPLYVYVPPGIGEGTRVPSIYLLTYYSGLVTDWLDRSVFDPSLIDRVDALFADDSVPRAVVVFADGMSRFGCSQWIDSIATAPYMSHLCEEIVPFIDERYPTLPDREHRGITGHSSGGSGALLHAMLHPELFSGVAVHGPDSLFEACYGREFPAVVRQLRDHFEGSYDFLLARFEERDHFEWDYFQPAIEIHQMALCYSPRPDDLQHPLLPFDIQTGEMIPEIFNMWLRWDPVRVVREKTEAMRTMKLVCLEAGKRDEYFLDLGIQAVSRTLIEAGVEHTLELFEGRHGGIKHRYPNAIRLLAETLAP